MTKNVMSVLVVATLSLWLSACTAMRPPGYGLPSADSVVPGDTYTVGRNEKIYAIAQKNGVKLREIIVLNELKPPYLLKQGQTITLPAKDRFAAPTPKAAPVEYIDKGYMAPASNGRGGAAGVVTVQEEQLAPISTGTPTTSPLPAFKKSEPVAAPPSTTWASTPQPAPVQEPAAEDTGAPIGVSSASKASRPTETTSFNVVEPEKKEEEIQPDPAATNTNFVPSFGWPVRGTVISGFGPKGKGLDNDGINISAPKGSPVKAAEGGMVAYAGNEMKGFGNLVLIRHEGGWVTAYAHLERLVVAKESIVAKGDMIGTVGTTGGVSSPQLHFETRRDGKPVDPELLIK